MALEQASTQRVENLPGMVGQSVALRRAAEHVSLIAETDATCLLSGETGTGKELFARAIHYLSDRKDGPFVPVNCGAIPDHLFENELFGHRRGAYTGAQSNEIGLLAYAEKGTLFLDEVDALSSSAQVKILRVLQEHEYRPVGLGAHHTCEYSHRGGDELQSAAPDGDPSVSRRSLFPPEHPEFDDSAAAGEIG